MFTFTNTGPAVEAGASWMGPIGYAEVIVHWPEALAGLDAPELTPRCVEYLVVLASARSSTSFRRRFSCSIASCAG